MLRADRLYYLSPEYITESFWTADYSSTVCGSYECGMYTGLGWHDCDGTNKTQQWSRVLKWARYDEHYEKVFKVIKAQGFRAPLTARANDDDSITFYDGHHRLAVAQDLDIVQVPVYIGPIDMKTEDLVAVDSRFWDGRSIDSPFLGMVA